MDHVQHLEIGEEAEAGLLLEVEGMEGDLEVVEECHLGDLRSAVGLAEDLVALHHDEEEVHQDV